MSLTAPEGVTRRDLLIRLVDEAGKIRGYSFPIASDATGGQIRAFAVALGSATHANVFAYEVQEVHEAAANAGVAGDGENNSVFDNIVLNFRNLAANQSIQVFIPAPLEANFIGDSENVDVTASAYDNFRGAVVELMPSGYVPTEVGFSQRRQIGRRSRNTGS